MRYYQIQRNLRGRPVTKLKKIFSWYIIRPFVDPVDFFYFTIKNKTDNSIIGKHYAGTIKVYRDQMETPRDWTRFCFQLVYQSRKNKFNA